jgi:phosphoglycerate kinase
MEVAGKRVLVRVDFNVPLKEGRVGDDTRLRASLPTVRLLLERGAAVVLMSHLGRPDGRRDPRYGMAPVAARFGELLGRPVAQADDCVGPSAEAAARAMAPRDVLLLENLRFHAGEEANDPGFARQLAGLGERYVNDAFGTAHRAHASTVGVARLLPSAAGLLLERGSRRSAARWTGRAARSSASSAARRSPRRSRCSTTCCRGSTGC